MLESYCIVFIIVLSVLLFGSIESWAFALVGTSTVVLFNVWIRRNHGHILKPDAVWQKVLLISVAGFFSAIVLQAVPLPAFLIKALAPSTYSLLNDISSKTLLSISFYPYATLNETVKVAVYFMIFIMMASQLNDQKSIRRIMLALVVFGFVLSVFSIIQNATWNGKIYWFRELSQGGSPFGPFVNRNHFAGLMGMVVPLGLGLVLESKRPEKTFLIAFLSLVMALGLVYSLSRGGILSFLVSTGFFSVLIATNSIRRKPILYLCSFIMAFILYTFYLGVSPIVERFATSGVSSESRLLVWSGTLAAFKDYPLFGTGLGTFSYVFPIYDPQGASHNFYYAHNDYLQLMLETGIVGGLFAGMFLISIAIATVKYSRSRGMPPTLAGLLASVLYMLVHSAFDFNLRMPSNAIAFSAILGMVFSYVKGANEEAA